MARALIRLTQSAYVGDPGIYVVLTAGITITLPDPGSWGFFDSITIKDQTGISNPNITVAPPKSGTIDGSAASIVIGTANEALTFVPSYLPAQWLVI